MMKLIDKLLKKLNVNRNTFFTFILTLVSFYICIDRLVEMLLMIFTGVSSSYWGPIKYTLALACPALAYAFAASSSFADNRARKVTLFYVYLIGIYIIAISMFTQWLNSGLWLLFTLVPNYVNIVTEFSGLVRAAFSAISLYIPLVTFYPFIVHKILLGINDSQLMVKSIWDYKGIDLSNKSNKHTAYTCDVNFVYDYFTGKKEIFGQNARYKSLLVCGGSGTGKTSRIFEPMIAQDIEKKFFFKEASKELGFTALKTGIATISGPYDNEYLNEHFSLNMLTPAFGKETLFKTFIQKMVLSSSPKTIYRDVGVTYLSPDNESIDKMIRVCQNYNVKYTLLDPLNTSYTKGLNPFVYDDPNKIAVTISSTLNGIKSIDGDNFSEDTVIQILENLTILLKLIYPKMNNGVLPNMEDLLKLLNNFNLVKKMCEILKNDEELAKDYDMQITFFERNFYPKSRGLKETEKYAFYISGRLENLLRYPKVKNILCNRVDNIDFDKALENGEFIFICTRRGEVGKFVSSAFGLFFLLSMQNAVLRRPGNESSRIPHYLYIDEFPDYLSRDTETIFTMYRKYCVGTTISAQSISMFGTSGIVNVDVKEDSQVMAKFNSTVLTNCSSKVFTGGSTPIDELQWWEKEIGQWKQWSITRGFDFGKVELQKTGSAKYGWETKVRAGQMQFFGDKEVAYKIASENGKPANSQGITNFMASKHNDKHNGKKYDFSKFLSGETVDESFSSRTSYFKKRKNVTSSNPDEEDPIQFSSSELVENDGDSIVVDFRKDVNKK